MAASDSKYPLGPYKLVTVNNAPERAKRLIGRVVEEVKEKYTIIHAGNADSEYFLLSFCSYTSLLMQSCLLEVWKETRRESLGSYDYQ